jgi:hypothetical protein
MISGIRSVFFILTLIPFLLKAQLPEISYKPFIPGEELKYNVHYGPINAGTAMLHVNPAIKTMNSLPHFLYYAQGLSNSSWDFFFKVRDYYYSYVDTGSLMPSLAIRNVREGDYSTTEKFIFKRDKNIVVSNDIEHNAPPDIMDLIAAVYYARCFDFNKIALNKEIPFNTFFENDLFQVGIFYEGKATIETKFGNIQCLVIKPKLVEGRVFKGQHDMTIYVTDDKNHIPIKILTAIFIGYIQADLISYKNTKYPLVFDTN